MPNPLRLPDPSTGATLGVTALIISLLIALVTVYYVPAAYADDDVTGNYDANGNDLIDRDEVLTAVQDYFANIITRDQVLQVISIYFTGEPIPDNIPTNDPSSPESTTEPDTQPDVESLDTVIERVRPSIVKIVSSRGVGSGVLFQTDDETGYALTSEHIIRNKDEVYVLVNDRKYYTGEVVSFDYSRDLAIVKICCGDFSTLEFAESETFNVGDEALAIGYAKDSVMPRNTDSTRVFVSGEASVTKGIISSFRYSTLTDTELLQFDGAINSGNSGSPILSMSGDILGVVSYSLYNSENIGFAVLETTVQKRLPSLLEGDSTYFGPLSGELTHDPDDDSISHRNTRVNIADLDIEATFFNPYALSSHQWDFGFLIRLGDQENLRVYLGGQENRGWYVTLYRDSELNTLDSGALDNLNVEEGESNHLRLIADGKQGTLFVNGEEVANLDLLYRTSPGDVAIGTGFVSGSDKAEAVTRYEGFTGRPISETSSDDE